MDESPTYILKYTTHTITAIASPNTQLNVPHDLHVTTLDDTSVQKVAKGWRTISKEDGDQFIVEIDGDHDTRFYVPFADALARANQEQKIHSKRKTS